MNFILFMAKRRVIGCAYCLVLILVYAHICLSIRSDQETRERFYGNLLNSSVSDAGDGSIAKMFDRVLEKEFPENEQSAGWFFIFIFKYLFLIMNL